MDEISGPPTEAALLYLLPPMFLTALASRPRGSIPQDSSCLDVSGYCGSLGSSSKIWRRHWREVVLASACDVISEGANRRAPCSCPYDAWGGSLFAFPCHPLECSAIQIAASCSVTNPLITS